MRIGHGYDVHRFSERGGADNNPSHIILGGVSIPHSRSLLAHSDGDVLVHALCDALLGAIGAGDIGHHFPETDPNYANADSRELLRRVYSMVEQRGLKIGNADMTIVAQAPKMAPHIRAMIDNISADLRVSVAQINIKASTTEGLGFAGREEGIAAHAVVLLRELFNYSDMSVSRGDTRG